MPMPAMIAEPFELRENPRALLGFDQHVVGPAQVAGQIGGLEDRFARRETERESDHGQRVGSKVAPQNDRDVQTGAGFGMP